MRHTRQLYYMGINLASFPARLSLHPNEKKRNMQINTRLSPSLIPRPCTFVACSTKFVIRTASDKRAGPGNENFVLQATNAQGLGIRLAPSSFIVVGVRGEPGNKARIN